MKKVNQRKMKKKKKGNKKIKITVKFQFIA